MPLSNAEVLKAAANFFDRIGVNKSEGGIIDMSTVDFGGMIPRKTVEAMIDLTRKQNAWIAAIDTITRTAATGTVPVMDFSEPMMEYVGENQGGPITGRPRNFSVNYACKKFKSDWYVTTEELREAAAANIKSFEQKMIAGWTMQLGNDMANVAINGNSALGTESRLNRMLRAFDGIKIQMAGANVYNALGKAWGMGIWDVMMDTLPDKYSNDPGYRWMFNRRVNNHWHASLTNVNTTEKLRSALGDQVLTQEVDVKPLGTPQIIVPQISSAQGPSGTPTAITDDGDGTMTIRVATLLPDATDSTGRKVKVTLKSNGIEEICTVSRDVSSQNVILTTGALGQTTISTTTTDYTIQIYDETDIYLCNPKSITMVICSGWRSYRKFNKDFDRYEITTYIEFTVLVPAPETAVVFNRVKVSPIATW